ncbi:hypothetical protein GCM10009632_04740 [Mycolicibacterium alvei]|uniref:Uncharacterized protein n=1 Tax=Mycolicibacterium alvei TaxID=67081 RepID=A0A6N4V4Q0_9MYCO|nr:hypothetical protein MALV_57060 [Mycolicibacterium alvei]
MMPLGTKASRGLASATVILGTNKPNINGQYRICTSTSTMNVTELSQFNKPCAGITDRQGSGVRKLGSLMSAPDAAAITDCRTW